MLGLGLILRLGCGSGPLDVLSTLVDPVLAVSAEDGVVSYSLATDTACPPVVQVLVFILGGLDRGCCTGSLS